MRAELKLHPDCSCDAVVRIEAECVRTRPATLALRYVVSGTIGDLLLPQPAAAARTDELWKHTCLEAFLRPGHGPGYFEFNFAPSSQWAAYRFSGYREGMKSVEEIAPPRIALRASGDDQLELSVSLDLNVVAGLAGGTAWHLGLSAVIEEKNGNKSYWALAHPPGRPDFHHPDCFAFELPAA